MQNDYIMRVIVQFVQALTSIARKRKEGHYKEAAEAVKTASRHYLRTDIDTLFWTHTPDQVVDSFKDFTDHLDTERCVLFADLLCELALIYEAEQKLEDTLHFKIAALHLYAVGIPKEVAFQSPQYFEKVKLLIQELRIQTFSEKVLESLLCYQQFLSTASKIKV